VVSNSLSAYTPTMPLEDREVMLGKLAIGRALLARPDALQAARAKASAEATGRPERFAQTLVRLGLLVPTQVRELETVIAERAVACSKCSERFLLRHLSRAGAERCGSCGGRPLFVQPASEQDSKGSGTIMTLGAIEEPVTGGSTFMDLAVEEGATTSAESPGDTGDFRTERTMELDAPDFGATPPAQEETGDFRTERTMELDAPDFGATPPAQEETGDFRTERTMELDAPDFGATPGAPDSDDEDADFQAERTLELDAPDFGATPLAAPAGDFMNERTMELNAPDFGAGPDLGDGASFGEGPSAPPEDDFQVERTMELDAPDFSALGGPVEGMVDVGATTALPPGWVQEVSAALPADGEATQEMSADAIPDFQREAFEPFEVGDGIKIMAPIARGGMGLVFRGQRPSGEVVAVKVLVDPSTKSPDILERFRREAVLTHGLDHPHIVRFHGAGIVSGGAYDQMPYYAMDYIAGRDLAAWVQERTRDPIESAKILVPICDALDYAHGRGVVHRDLKPGNVLVRAADEAPFLCDFGLAKLRQEASTLTQTGDILGTPSYMAPEQARGQGKLIGPPTDVHAIGALLYFLLAGRAPFVGPKPFEVLRQVVQDDPRLITELNSAVPPVLGDIVHRALKKSPQDRFHTAGELKAALLAL